MSQFQYLSTLRVDELSARFHQKVNDLQFLSALNEELKKRRSDAAIDLQMRVATALVKARRASNSDTVATLMNGGPKLNLAPPAHADWLDAYLGKRGLAQPTGDPLFRYRMGDDEYEAAKARLKTIAAAGLLESGNNRTAAMFVACCAEWFRREATSTFKKWEALSPEIYFAVPISRHDLTERGLDFWKRPLKDSIRGREFLLTLALEGGFPVKILRDGANSWLRNYLRALVRRGLVDEAQTAVELEEIAGEEGWLVRKSYRHEDFLTLCSELAMNIVQLRRLADSKTVSGVANTIILDKIRPGWRNELPIYVPAEDQQLADVLLQGLIDEKIGVLTANGLETRRYLIKQDDGWAPAVQVLAEGELPAANLQLSLEGRARAIPAGDLGNFISGELALLEPPIDSRGKWRVRPFSRAPKLLPNFPFLAPVQVALTSSFSSPQRIIWPKGDSLRSEVLVFQEDEASTTEAPLLRYWRSGSASSRSKALYVLVPSGWCVEGNAGGDFEDLGKLPALGRKLIKVSGIAYFRGDTSGSSRYRVATGEEQADRELDLKVVEAGFDLADEQLELVEAGHEVLISEGIKRPRAATAGELFIRQQNTWRELRGPLIGLGRVELSWRDPNANIQLERRQLILLPRGARVSGLMKSAVAGQITLEGLPGWSISLNVPGCEAQLEGAKLNFEFARRPMYRLPLTLTPPNGEPFDIIVPLRARDGILALADGTIIAPRSHLDPARLRGGVISTPRQQTLEVTCRGAKWASARMLVDGELPLGSLRESVNDMFAVLPDQDDELDLDFIGDTQPPIRIGRYRYKQLRINTEKQVLWAEHSEPNVTPVARMILDPRHEHALEVQSPDLWRVPERCSGPCLIYLRDNVDVLSRPIPIGRPARPGLPGSLTEALLTIDMRHRKEKVISALQALSAPGYDSSDFNWLLSAACNLNGLPPGALDALKYLPAAPISLIRLLLKSDSEQRPTIWSLQNALPFLWLSLPVTAWNRALQLEFEAVEQLLRPVLGAEGSVAAALARLQGVRAELLTFEPGLEATFAHTNLPMAVASPLVSLNDLTGAYVRAQLAREGEREGTNDLARALIIVNVGTPQEIQNKQHIEHSGLFAPVLLAAAARGKLTLSTDQSLLARRTMREDPLYVSQAYRHLLKAYA